MDQTSTLAPVTTSDQAALETITSRTRSYAEQSLSQNTRRAYTSDWSHFTAWCAGVGFDPLPAAPETVALYITSLVEQGRKASTVQRRLTAISQAHKTAGYATPTTSPGVRAVWSGIRREHGTAQAGKAPVMTADLRAMVETLPDSLSGLRDQALLLVGFAGGFRRSELVALDTTDVQETADGLVVTIRRSKTDQDGQGRRIGLPYGSNPATCPVRALRAWYAASGITAGPLFRPINRHGQLQGRRLTAQSVALVVKRVAEAAGLDPARFSGHSLRSGLATSAAAAGVSERSIMNQTGHKSVVMVRKYIREGSLFRDNAAAGVGL
jgi:site-specific recombinase XerD